MKTLKKDDFKQIIIRMHVEGLHGYPDTIHAVTKRINKYIEDNPRYIEHSIRNLIKESGRSAWGNTRLGRFVELYKEMSK